MTDLAGEKMKTSTLQEEVRENIAHKMKMISFNCHASEARIIPPYCSLGQKFSNESFRKRATTYRS